MAKRHNSVRFKIEPSWTPEGQVFGWVLVSGNGRDICYSVKDYPSRSACVRAILTMQWIMDFVPIKPEIVGARKD
jgi:hypothetical protein